MKKESKKKKDAIMDQNEIHASLTSKDNKEMLKEHI